MPYPRSTPPNPPNCEPCPPCGWWVSVKNALIDIPRAIRELISAQPITLAQGVIHYPISGYGNLTKAGGPASVQLFLNPLDYEIIGIGVSYLGSFPTVGSSPSDDKLLIKFWNYTTNAQIGNTLQMSVAQVSDKHTNEGSPIGANLALGNIGGVKIYFDDTEGSTFTGKAFDFFLFVRPLQLNAPTES